MIFILLGPVIAGAIIVFGFLSLGVFAVLYQLVRFIKYLAHIKL
jgi:hypothetical protein